MKKKMKITSKMAQVKKYRPRKSTIENLKNKLITSLATPHNFVMTVSSEVPYNEPGLFTVTIRSEAIKIELDVNFDSKHSYYLADGHVHFDAGKHGWRSFDRYGVESSFYINTPKSEKEVKTFVQDVNKKILEQIVRAADAIKGYQNRIQVPGTQFTVTPEGKAEIVEKLRDGQRHTFYPSGFGSSLTLSTFLNNYSTKNDALAEFFGVPMIFVERRDND